MVACQKTYSVIPFWSKYTQTRVYSSRFNPLSFDRCARAYAFGYSHCKTTNSNTKKDFQDITKGLGLLERTSSLVVCMKTFTFCGSKLIRVLPVELMGMVMDMDAALVLLKEIDAAGVPENSDSIALSDIDC